MPQAVFVQDGEFIDHTPITDIAAGEVIVQGDLVGVAHRAIPAGTPGALAIGGVFDFAKNTGPAYTIGQLLYWDDAANVVSTVPGGKKQIGKAVRAAAAADTSVRVYLSQ
jgi:predicted RecA/RadA family phage recombinase